MTALFFILLFISLYGVSMTGGKKGTGFFLSGLILHTGYIIYRWVFLRRLPVTEKHDILLFIALIVAFSFLYFYKRISLNLLLNTLPLFLSALCFLAIFQERIDTTAPNMESPWFYLHMILFISGYSLLIIGSLSGVFYFKDKTAILELIQYKSTLLGWLLFSFSLIAGSVWFYLVYGVYWLWTAKELWTTIVWFFYSFYLHARMIKSLYGLPASALGTAGSLIIIFSYLGVTPLLGSPWTQF